MDIHIDKLNNSSCRVVVKLKFSEVKSFFNDAFSYIIKKTSLPGFRKGTIPRNIIRKRFYSDIESRFVSTVFYDIYPKAIFSKKLKIVGQPVFEKYDFLENKYLDISFKIDIYPEPKIKKYVKLSITKQELSVDDEYLNMFIQNVLKDRSKHISRKSVKNLEKKDFWKCDYVLKASEKGQVFLQEKDKILTISPDSKNVRYWTGDHSKDLPSQNVYRPLFDILTKMNLQEKKSIWMDVSSDSDQKEKNASLHKIFVELKLTEVFFSDVQNDLTDDFVQDLKIDKVNNVSQYRSYIKNILQDNFNNQSKQLEDKALMDELIKENSFDIPFFLISEQAKSLMKQEKEELSQRNFTQKEIQKHLNTYEKDIIQKAERGVREYLLLEAIAKKEKITISDEDLGESLIKISKKGQESVSAEEVKKYLSNSKNRESINRSKCVMKQCKTFDYVRSVADINKVSQKETSEAID